jgi:quercetin dioxygenase-like cupin family protein
MRRSTMLLPFVLVVVATLWGDGRAAGQSLTAAPDAQVPGIEATVLATRLLVEVPAGRRWVLRARHPLDEDADAHAGGFIYAASGQSTLVVVEAQGIVMNEGQAAWAPEDIAHLHRSQTRASSQAYGASAPGVEIWSILLERPAEARLPGALAMSPLLAGIQSGPYQARLVAEAYQPGASTALRRRTGPELAYLLDGSWELTYDGVPFSLKGGDGYLADPQVAHQLRNVGGTAARLLSAQLVPEGSSAEEPVP